MLTLFFFFASRCPYTTFWTVERCPLWSKMRSSDSEDEVFFSSDSEDDEPPYYEVCGNPRIYKIEDLWTNIVIVDALFDIDLQKASVRESFRDQLDYIATIKDLEDGVAGITMHKLHEQECLCN